MALAQFLGGTWKITPQGGALTVIGGVYGCSFAGGGSDKDDITVADDTVTQIRRGLVNSSSFTLKVRRNLQNVGQIALLSMWTLNKTGVLLWTFPNTAGTATFNVYVQSVPNTVALGSHLISDIVFKVNGAPIFAD